MAMAESSQDPSLLRIGATTSMQVAADLRRRILQGELVPGQRLKIDEIAVLCGVSHMPVRTALQELEAEGILDVHPRRGAEIRMIDADYITSMLDVRGAMEVMLTAKCATMIDEAGLTILEGLVIAFEEQAKLQDPAGMLRANLQLHSYINGVAKNPEALRVLARGRLLIEAMRIRYGYGGARTSTIIEEHRQIYDAIRRQDVKTAREIALQHCEHARDELLNLLKS
ncbi:GntR family transcriptional regulator [Rhizobium sp.]|uniref:GntR family transcriptional regulator n=1 Tax=Rhizobium sp. TaxID=391 RepID=UPI0028A2D71F